jgi:hypothetical protein
MSTRNRADASLKQSEVDFFIEGQVRANEQSPVSMEVRLDGPDYKEVSKGCFKVHVSVNHIITVLVDEQDLYVYDKVMGLAQAMYENCIPVFKYGDGPDDDNSGLFELIRVDKLRTIQYGQVNEKTRLLQGSVTGEYFGFIKE